MLMLKRRLNEALYLYVPGYDKPIRVLIMDIAKPPFRNVVLGIDAPACVEVHRQEIAQRVRLSIDHATAHNAKPAPRPVVGP